MKEKYGLNVSDDSETMGTTEAAQKVIKEMATGGEYATSSPSIDWKKTEALKSSTEEEWGKKKDMGKAIPSDDPVNWRNVENAWMEQRKGKIREFFTEPEWPAAAKVKEKGNPLYKTGKVEPIDLIRDGGMLWPFALGNIIKYAFRLRLNQYPGGPNKDLEKIIHYAEILLVEVGGK